MGYKLLTKGTFYGARHNIALLVVLTIQCTQLVTVSGDKNIIWCPADIDFSYLTEEYANMEICGKSGKQLCEDKIKQFVTQKLSGGDDKCRASCDKASNIPNVAGECEVCWVRIKYGIAGVHKRTTKEYQIWKEKDIVQARFAWPEKEYKDCSEIGNVTTSLVPGAYGSSTAGTGTPVSTSPGLTTSSVTASGSETSPSIQSDSTTPTTPATDDK